MRPYLPGLAIIAGGLISWAFVHLASRAIAGQMHRCPCGWEGATWSALRRHKQGVHRGE